MKTFLLYVTIAFIVSIIVCFYLGFFIAAYILMGLLVSMISALGWMVNMRNHDYLQEKNNEYRK